MHAQLGAEDVEIAHLKMTLRAGEQLASINLVRTDFVPELGIRLHEPVSSATLTVNLRAESTPEKLASALRNSLESIGDWQLVVDHVEAFRPGRPEPTHRDTVTPSST